jgi:hypothetical protein
MSGYEGKVGNRYAILDAIKNSPNVDLNTLKNKFGTVGQGPSRRTSDMRKFGWISRNETTRGLSITEAGLNALEMPEPEFNRLYNRLYESVIQRPNQERTDQSTNDDDEIMGSGLYAWCEPHENPELVWLRLGQTCDFKRRAGEHYHPDGYYAWTMAVENHVQVEKPWLAMVQNLVYELEFYENDDGRDFVAVPKNRLNQFLKSIENLAKVAIGEVNVA